MSHVQADKFPRKLNQATNSENKSNRNDGAKTEYIVLRRLRRRRNSAISTAKRIPESKQKVETAQTSVLSQPNGIHANSQFFNYVNADSASESVSGPSSQSPVVASNTPAYSYCPSLALSASLRENFFEVAGAGVGAPTGINQNPDVPSLEELLNNLADQEPNPTGQGTESDPMAKSRGQLRDDLGGCGSSMSSGFSHSASSQGAEERYIENRPTSLPTFELQRDEIIRAAQSLPDELLRGPLPQSSLREIGPARPIQNIPWRIGTVVNVPLQGLPQSTGSKQKGYLQVQITPLGFYWENECDSGENNTTSH